MRKVTQTIFFTHRSQKQLMWILSAVFTKSSPWSWGLIRCREVAFNQSQMIYFQNLICIKILWKSRVPAFINSGKRDILSWKIKCWNISKMKKNTWAIVFLKEFLISIKFAWVKYFKKKTEKSNFKSKDQTENFYFVVIVKILLTFGNKS